MVTKNGTSIPATAEIESAVAHLATILARGFVRMRQKPRTGSEKQGENSQEIAPPEALKMLPRPCSLSLPVNGRRVAKPGKRSPK